MVSKKVVAAQSHDTTKAAYVDIHLDKDGKRCRVSVPGKNSTQLLDAGVAAAGVGGTVFAPKEMAMAISTAKVEMSAPYEAACLVSVALLPAAIVIIYRSRRSR